MIFSRWTSPSTRRASQTCRKPLEDWILKPSDALGPDAVHRQHTGTVSIVALDGDEYAVALAPASDSLRA
jgi:hypothetical protein